MRTQDISFSPSNRLRISLQCQTLGDDLLSTLVEDIQFCHVMLAVARAITYVPPKYDFVERVVNTPIYAPHPDGSPLSADEMKRANPIRYESTVIEERILRREIENSFLSVGSDASVDPRRVAKMDARLASLVQETLQEWNSVNQGVEFVVSGEYLYSIFKRHSGLPEIEILSAGKASPTSVDIGAELTGIGVVVVAISVALRLMVSAFDQARTNSSKLKQQMKVLDYAIEHHDSELIKSMIEKAETCVIDVSWTPEFLSSFGKAFATRPNQAKITKDLGNGKTSLPARPAKRAKP